MTLYYTLVFFLLMAEMGIFMGLVVPLPYSWRKTIFTFISTNKFVAQLQYMLKITFVFILILFIDSVNRVYRVQTELADSKAAGGQGSVLGHERMEVQARKFYSQRNMYLCGFTLFLSLILNRTYVLILDILKLEQTVKDLRAESNERVRSDVDNKMAKKLEETTKKLEETMKKLEEMTEKLEAKDREIEALHKQLGAIKKQAEGLSREYNALADRYAAVTGSDNTSKKDL